MIFQNTQTISNFSVLSRRVKDILLRYPRRISKISKAKTWIISRKARYTRHIYSETTVKHVSIPNIFLISFSLSSRFVKREGTRDRGEGRVRSRPVIDELSRRVIRGERIRGEGFRDSRERATPALPSPRP